MNLGYATLPEMQAWAEGIMQREQDFVIGDRQLLRWWIIPRNEQLNVYLHAVLKSDEDRAMHDHPWANVSYLISGSYIEHTPEGRVIRKAGDVVKRSAEAMHRLEVIPGEKAMSLFITGPKVREWGFDCPHGWIHWEDFVSRENKGLIGRGCGEHGDLSPVTPAGHARPVPVGESI
ncbi:hypothetical protein [Novosphingobium sp. AP12]|uniref:hypothetical protein n=1 Tax=Novosphingobium sp. AP12 TaxID=1144305 RepID=UPI000271E2E9|nr:hypothetical protein [Novosphingobium sp. AP12]EJL21930.1 hypothetical protein PMI02_04915 [Novosphingobium sp. AP12]